MTNETAQPTNVGSNDGLGLAERLLRHWHTTGGHLLLMREAAAEIERLRHVTKAANDQADRFKRIWYLAKDNADRSAFPRRLKGRW